MEYVILALLLALVPFVIFVAICRWIFSIDTIVGQLKKINRNLDGIARNQEVQEENIVQWLKRLEWYAAKGHIRGKKPKGDGGT